MDSKPEVKFSCPRSFPGTGGYEFAFQMVLSVLMKKMGRQQKEEVL